MYGDSAECVDLLLKAGADVNATDIKACTVLFQGEEFHFRWSHHPTLVKCIKRVLRAGIKINIRGSSEITALTSFVKYLNIFATRATKRDEEFAMLLFAAGDTLDESKIKHVPDYLKPSAEVSLMNICRGTIRKHLLQIGDINLFLRIPKLGLPAMLCQRMMMKKNEEMSIK